MKTLDKVPLNTYARVKKIAGGENIRKRLISMGITPGAEIFVRKRAPLGDPIEISVRNYELSLRKEEVSGIEVL